jgi:hypothetical protein
MCWFFTHSFTGILIFKGLTARRLCKSFGVKGLKKQFHFVHSLTPTSEFSAHLRVSKLQRLRNDIPRTIVNFSKPTPTRDLYVAFRMPSAYIVITNYVGGKQKSFKIVTRIRLCNTERSEVNTQKI